MSTTHQAQEDPEFIGSSKELLKGSGDLSRAEMVPTVKLVVELVMAKEERRLSELDKYHDKLYRADQILDRYVGNHYGNFNDSIRYFADMVKRINEAKSAIASTKTQLDGAATRLEGRGPQLDTLTRRAAQAVLMRRIAKDALECIQAQAVMTRLLDDLRFNAAVSQLQRYTRLTRRPRLQSIRGLGAAVGFVNAAGDVVQARATIALLRAAFREHARDDPHRHFGRVFRDRAAARAGGTVMPQGPLGAVTAARLDAAVVERGAATTGGDADAGEDTCTDPCDWYEFIPNVTRALRRVCGPTIAVRVAIATHTAPMLDAHFAAFTRAYVSWVRADVADGRHSVVSRAAAMRMSRYAPPLSFAAAAQNAARAQRGGALEDDATLAAVQRQALDEFFGALLDEALKLVRNIDYAVACTAAADIPFVGAVRSADLLVGVRTPEAWAVETCVLSAEAWTPILETVETQARVAARARSGDVEAILQSVLDFDEPSASDNDDDAEGDEQLFPAWCVHGSSSRVGSLSYRAIMRSVEYRAANAPSARRAAGVAVDAAVRLLGDELREALQSELKTRVETFVSCWDLRAFWGAVQEMVYTATAALCAPKLIGLPVPVRVLPSAVGGSSGGAAPLSTASCRVSSRTLSDMLGRQGNSKMPVFIESMGYTGAVPVSAAAAAAASMLPTSATADLAIPSVVDGVFDTAVTSPFPTMRQELVTGLQSCITCNRFNILALLPRVLELRRVVQREFPIVLGFADAGREAGRSVATPLEVKVAELAQAQVVAPAYMHAIDRLASMMEPHTEGSTRPPLQACAHPLSPDVPVLTVCRFVHDVVADYFAVFFSGLATDAGDTLVADAARRTSTLIEALLFFLKEQLHRAAGESFAFEAIMPMRDNPSDPVYAARWEELERSVANPLLLARKTPAALAEPLFRVHKARVAQSAGADRRLEATVSQVNCERLPSLSATTEVALVAHSLEWLAGRLQLMCLEQLPSTPGVAPARTILAQAQADAMSLSRAALFMLSADAALISYLHLPDMRDATFNLNAASSQPDTFVSDFTADLRATFGVLLRHLTPSRCQWTATTVARPAADLLLLEVTHLRDKRVTPAGARQLMLDALSIQAAIASLLPATAARGGLGAEAQVDVATQLTEAFRRPLEFFSMLQRDDEVSRARCVYNVIARGMLDRFELSELEMLLALALRSADGRNAALTQTAAQVAILREAHTALQARALGKRVIAVSDHYLESLLRRLCRPSGARAYPNEGPLAASSTAGATSSDEAEEAEEAEEDADESSSAASTPSPPANRPATRAAAAGLTSTIRAGASTLNRTTAKGGDNQALAAAMAAVTAHEASLTDEDDGEAEEEEEEEEAESTTADDHSPPPPAPAPKIAARGATTVAATTSEDDEDEAEEEEADEEAEASETDNDSSEKSDDPYPPRPVSTPSVQLRLPPNPSPAAPTAAAPAANRFARFQRRN